MNPWIGWALAVGLVAVGWMKYGWPGVAMAVTVVVFWLLLQFNRAVTVMKNAADAPVGFVPSAVMMNAKLKRGMTLMQVVTLTKSLGRQVSKSPEIWAWTDEGNSTVSLVMADGKLDRWTLVRPEEGAAPGDPKTAAE
ncbi:hypothetical protein BH11PSE9_BH11PSE9_36800 [soil metagenome]